MDYPLVVGNWKMNLTLSEATILVGQISRNAEYIKHVNIVLCPPSVFIYPARDALKAKPNNLYLGLQNTMWEKDGSYTGEVSLSMTRNICKYSIVGHSERRRLFNESDEIVAKKVRFCLDNGITPIVCVGETEKFNLEDHFTTELKRMKSSGGILSQVDQAISKLKKEEIKNIYFAYEPIWAIGTGNAATGVYASAVSYIIRNSLKEARGIADEDMRILYGGSIEESNVKEFMMQPNLNGLLVGGASLKAKDFCKICQITSEVKSGK
jgi:triosephosphate isomerase